MKKQRHTNNVPATAGLYFQAMMPDKLAFISGQLSLAPQESSKNALH